MVKKEIISFDNGGGECVRRIGCLFAADKVCQYFIIKLNIKN